MTPTHESAIGVAIVTAVAAAAPLASVEGTTLGVSVKDHPFQLARFTAVADIAIILKFNKQPAELGGGTLQIGINAATH